MKGFAMLKIGEVGWIEKDRPQCGPLDAICKPLAVALCTSDVHTVWEGAVGERHNMILGHECCAQVVEVGSEVRDFKPGDRVLIPAITPNWSSLEAQAGYAMHSDGMLAGWKFSNIKDGVFSEYFHVNDADGNLALLPEGMDIVDACMLSDMVPTGFHGVELADVQFGDTVLVVGIGPGFTAGEDCHAVVETMRGHTLGRVIYRGSALPNTNIPGLIGGYAGERVLRAPAEGIFCQKLEIGAVVRAGDIAGEVAGQPMRCTIDGVLRGILADGTPVFRGMKAGDVDPRCKPEYCTTASDKALAVGGGVLEAVLHLHHQHPKTGK